MSLKQVLPGGLVEVPASGGGGGGVTNGQQLFDDSHVLSLDAGTRQLFAADGTTPTASFGDPANGVFFGADETHGILVDSSPGYSEILFRLGTQVMDLENDSGATTLNVAPDRARVVPAQSLILAAPKVSIHSVNDASPLDRTAINNLAIGGYNIAVAPGNGAIALGTTSRVFASRAASLGYEATASGVSSVALGYGYATGQYSFAYGQAGTTFPVFQGTIAGSVYTVTGDEIWGGATLAPTAIYRAGDAVLLYKPQTDSVFATTISALDATTVTLAAAPTAGDGAAYLLFPDSNTGVGDYGQSACGVLPFQTGGDAQVSEWQLAALTTGATATRLSQNGITADITNQIRVFTGQVRAFTVDCVGLKDDGTALHIVKTGAIKNVGGTVSLVGSVTTVSTQADGGAGPWVVAITADNTDKLLAITVTGAAASNIRWLAHVKSTEVAWFPVAA